MMPSIFWTGKLSLPSRLLVNTGSIIAWFTGNARNTYDIKERMRDGYDGKYSDCIQQYDELASFHYEKVSNKLLENVDCEDKDVIDVGCGTGYFLSLR